MAYVDIWQTLGPVHSPEAGGDAPPDSVELDPLGGGISWKRVVIPPAAALAELDGAKLSEEMRRRAPGMGRGGHHDPDSPGRHRTDTIDLVQILSGEITLCLDDDASVDLAAGDCVIQRGTWHTWTNRGDQPCVFQATLLHHAAPGAVPLGGFSLTPVLPPARRRLVKQPVIGLRVEI